MTLHKIQEYCMWLILTDGEHKLHDASVRKFRILCSERMYRPIFSATGGFIKTGSTKFVFGQATLVLMSEILLIRKLHGPKNGEEKMQVILHGENMLTRIWGSL